MKLAALLAALGLAGLAAGAPCAGWPDADEGTAPRLAGTLEQSSPGLAYRDAGGKRHALKPAAALPYRLVSLGPPLLITAIGEDLQPVTYAGVASFTAYPGYLPVLAKPPIVALGPAGARAGDSLLLLGPEGGPGLRLPGAELLVPASGDGGGTALAVLPGAAPDDVWTLGQNPRLCAIDCLAMQERWRLECGGKLPVAGVDLIAQCRQGIVAALQHDYEKYSWLVIGPDGDLRSSTPFDGQPAVNLVWPGPTPEFAHARCEGSLVELGVSHSTGGTSVLQFDLRTGAVRDTGVPPRQRPQRDERGCESAAGRVIVSQGLLPRASGPEWSIPAVTDGGTRVLVVTAAGPEWWNYKQ